MTEAIFTWVSIGTLVMVVVALGIVA